MVLYSYFLPPKCCRSTDLCIKFEVTRTSGLTAIDTSKKNNMANK